MAKVGEIIDQYSFLDYKDSFLQAGVVTGVGSGSLMAPTWINQWNTRRIRAYMVLEAYYRNSARAHMNPDADLDDITNRREFGDPYVIVETILSSLIGNDQQIFVPEALNPAAKAGSKPDADGPGKPLLEKLQEWATDEKFFLRLAETERNAIKLGDGVFVLGWNVKLKRPKLRIYSPNAYFPVLFEETLDENGWPTVIHIAYEFVRKVADEEKKFVRRITWRMAPPASGGTVQYKWNTEPVDRTCFYSDGVWESINPEKWDVDTFTEAKGVYVVKDQDLKLDFIPVVHIPNTPAEEDHFGISSLSPVLQLLDDLAANDSDTSLSSSLVGSPPLAINNATMVKDSTGNIPSYGPRTVLETGEGGATLLDTSHSLDALLKYREKLESILSVNARVPATLLGRVDPSKVPSGIVLTLSFSPHSGLIRQMRQIREDKYRLLLKFVTRMFWADGQVDAEFDALVKFGSYLPADKTEVMNLVVQGLQVHAISVETSILMLIEAGLPIQDAQEEIARIVLQDFEAAGKLLDATGDVNEARKRLGLGPAPVLAQPDTGGGAAPAPPGGGPTPPPAPTAGQG